MRQLGYEGKKKKIEVGAGTSASAPHVVFVPSTSAATGLIHNLSERERAFSLLGRYGICSTERLRYVGFQGFARVGGR